MRRNSCANIIVGLDVGTTKICAVVAEAEKGNLTFRGVTTSPSAGLRKGLVVNIDAAVESIKNALKTAESETGVEINAVYVGISGGHIKGFNGHGAIGVRAKEVSEADVDRVIDSAQAVYVPLDREVLHVVPAGYTLDGQNGILDPVGMIGGRLEAKVYIITGAVTAVQNLLKCCDKAGVDVIDIVFEPLASAEAILTEKEKELGVTVVDIGGGTTDIITYKDRWLKHSAVLAIGGNHFTNDVAVGLRIPSAEAERIKKEFGAALTSMVQDSEEIEVQQAGQVKKISRRHLAEIIQPRAEELLELVKRELMLCSGYRIASTGVVLTGGGALLEGIEAMAEAALELPVRIGFPGDAEGCEDIIRNPMYSTGAGLVLYGSEAESEGVFYTDALTGIFGKMRDWVTGILR